MSQTIKYQDAKFEETKKHVLCSKQLRPGITRKCLKQKIHGTNIGIVLIEQYYVLPVQIPDCSRCNQKNIDAEVHFA